MWDEDFKNFVKEIINEVKQYSPSFVLDDSRGMFIISSGMQNWTVAQLAATWVRLR